MKKITAKLVKELRDKTGAGMMDAKKALQGAEGDVQKAIDNLRKSGALKAQKKSDRMTGQGLVHSYIHGGGRIGVLLEVNSETDFVARNENFKNLVHELALHIAAANPLYISRDNVPKEVLSKEREIYEGQAKNEGKPKDVTKKIVEGKLEKYFQEVCLLEQPFAKDPDITIEELVNQSIARLGENIQIKRFVRYELGE